MYGETVAGETLLIVKCFGHLYGHTGLLLPCSYKRARNRPASLHIRGLLEIDEKGVSERGGPQLLAYNVANDVYIYVCRQVCQVSRGEAWKRPERFSKKSIKEQVTTLDGETTTTGSRKRFLHRSIITSTGLLYE